MAVEDIAKVLNHSYGPRVTQVYNAYSYDREKRLALMKWARRLTAVLDQEEINSNVTLFTRRGA